MSSWSGGYVSEIDYTYDYFTELNPLRVEAALIHAGIKPPIIRTACELGFGQGLSIAIHSAASDIEWYGTDFLPSQASLAQELGAIAGTNAQLFDEAFEEFCSREDLPGFDYICLHGIWSWVSESNREIILDFVRRKLNVGGVLYVGYNTMPGWAAYAPIRHLMNNYSQQLHPASDALNNKVEGALNFVSSLEKVGAQYFLANPSVSERLQKNRTDDKAYLAHEFFNSNWQPFHFSDIAKQMGSAKMNYGCSAVLLEHFDKLNFSKDQQVYLRQFKDKLLNETLKDYLSNQTFRRDYWVKGRRELTGLERSEAIQKLVFMLQNNPDGFLYKLNSPMGEIKLDENIYRPILESLADFQPHSLVELYSKVKKSNITLDQVAEAIFVLMGTSELTPVKVNERTETHQDNTAALNKHIVELARSRSEIGYLASPATGGGIKLERMQQLFLGAKFSGATTADEFASKVWPILKAQNQKLVNEGKKLESDEENLAALKIQASDFIDRTLPILEASKIA